MTGAEIQAATVDPIREQVVEAARRLAAQRLVVGTTGNVSARIGGRVWITPTRTPYSDLRPADLAGVELPRPSARAGHRGPDLLRAWTRGHGSRRAARLC